MLSLIDMNAINGMYAGTESPHHRTMTGNCFFLAFKRSKGNKHTHTNTCEHTFSVAMHISHTHFLTQLLPEEAFLKLRGWMSIFGSQF